MNLNGQEIPANKSSTMPRPPTDLSVKPKNFAVTGVAGYVATRHLKAIYETGNRVIACLDPSDSVGFLDQYSDEIRFFTEFERFDRHLEKLKREKDSAEHPHYLSICSPNYLHDAHIRSALRLGCDAICEKPVVLNPWNVDALQELEIKSGRKVYTILQLRVHPTILKLKKELDLNPKAFHEIELTYCTSRGSWYDFSWKGDPKLSGGLATNIGIHFFDMFIWLFGAVQTCEVHLSEDRRAAGYLELERGRVRWFLSVNRSDVPFETAGKPQVTYRSIKIDGKDIEFSEGFHDLHTKLYQEILKGRGFGLEQARPSVLLVHDIRHAKTIGAQTYSHPLVKNILGSIKHD